MPRYDYECSACGKSEERDCTVAARHEQVCACGADLTKVMKPPAVHDDTIIGGFWQEHFGPEREYFDSRRKMAARADQLGLRPFVRHKSDNPGTDKSSKTSRWV